MPADPKIAKAANDLEKLAAYMRDLIVELREGDSINVAYAKVYYLRQDLGYIVSSLGSGIPRRSSTPIRPLKLVDR